jgi:endonuclease G
MEKRSIRWSWLLVVVMLALSCQWLGKQTGTLDVASTNRNVRFGTPKWMGEKRTFREETIIERDEFVMGYNDTDKIANWVSWQLVKEDIGEAPRSSFQPDPLLPTGFTRVTGKTYEGSGFDRGHLCNSKDRTSSPEANSATFVMSNMVPQAPNCNQKGWEEFESYCRRLTKDGSELYIVAGPHGKGGEGSKGERDFIGKGDVQVKVPAYVWKSVMVLHQGESAPNRNTRTIGIWMPNDQSVNTDWKKHIVSVTEIEKRSGYQLYPLVDEGVARSISSRRDQGD